MPLLPPAKLRARRGMTKRRAAPPSATYAVGYCKPPKAGQYRKGVSGHRSGRPKGAKNVATLLVEALSEEVTITENGSPRRISKLEMMFKQLADQGAAGDLRALRMVLDRVDAALNRVDAERAEVLDDLDQDVAQALIQRIRNAPQEPCHD